MAGFMCGVGHIGPHGVAFAFALPRVAYASSCSTCVNIPPSPHVSGKASVATEKSCHLYLYSHCSIYDKGQWVPRNGVQNNHIDGINC
jgi:hypothetical protein